VLLENKGGGMKKTVLMISMVIFGMVFLYVFQTLKGTQAGAQQDLVNTGDNLSQGVNTVLEADRKFAEKYW